MSPESAAIHIPRDMLYEVRMKYVHHIVQQQTSLQENGKRDRC